MRNIMNRTRTALCAGFAASVVAAVSFFALGLGLFPTGFLALVACLAFTDQLLLDHVDDVDDHRGLQEAELFEDLGVGDEE